MAVKVQKGKSCTLRGRLRATEEAFERHQTRSITRRELASARKDHLAG